MDDVSSRSGMSDLNMAQEGEDNILKKEELDVRSNEVEGGKSQVHDDLSGTPEDYLLDLELAEISNGVDYGTSRGSQASLLKSYITVPGNSKTDYLGMSGPAGAIVQVADSQNIILNPTNSEHGISTHDYGCETLVEKSFTIHDFDKLEDVSGLLAGHLCSDKDSDMFLCPGFTCEGAFDATFKENGQSTSAGQAADIESRPKEDELLKSSIGVSSDDPLPALKRPRKPTRRYVEESAELMSISKRKVPSSTSKDKFLRDRRVREKDNHTRQVTANLLTEEATAKPIQVPFGPLAGREQSERKPSNAVGPQISRERSKRHPTSAVSPIAIREHNKRHPSSAIVPLTGREHTNRHPSSAVGPLAGRELSKRHPSAVPNAEDESSTDEWESNCTTKVKSEEDRARRKHHRLWTIAEVKKLIEGVAQYGVGKWSDIKSQFFSSSIHRTPVDLKDKWRNLLKASRLQSGGENKRSMSWRPLPKSILNRVTELANMYPYPRVLKSKVPHVQHISSPTSINRNTDALPNNSRRNGHWKSGS